MFSLKTVFRRMTEASTKCTWWTILLKLSPIIMHVILMVLIVVIASVIASSMTMWPMKVTTTSKATSTMIITIVIIIIATTRRIKFPTVSLKLASIVILLSPSPLLRPSVWSPVIIFALHSPYFLLATDCTSWSFVVYCCCFCLYFGCGGGGTNYFGECCESVPWNHTGSYVLSRQNIYIYLNTCLCYKCKVFIVEP